MSAESEFDQSDIDFKQPVPQEEQQDSHGKENLNPQGQYELALRKFYLGMSPSEIQNDQMNPANLMSKLRSDLVNLRAKFTPLDEEKSITVVDPETRVRSERKVGEILADKEKEDPDYADVLQAAVAVQQELFTENNTIPAEDVPYDMSTFNELKKRLEEPLVSHEAMDWEQEDVDKIKEAAVRKIEDSIGAEAVECAVGINTLLESDTSDDSEEDDTQQKVQAKIQELLQVTEHDIQSGSLSEDEIQIAHKTKTLQNKINAIDGIPRYIRQNYLSQVAENMVEPTSKEPKLL